MAFVGATLVHWAGLVSMTPAFWGLLVLTFTYSSFVQQPERVKKQLVGLSALAVFIMVTAHLIRFEGIYTDFMAVYLSAGWVAVAVALACYWHRLRKA